MGLLQKIKQGRIKSGKTTSKKPVLKKSSSKNKSSSNKSKSIKVKARSAPKGRLGRSVGQINSNNVTLVVVPNNNYNSSVLNFVKKLDKKSFGYVSVNKGYSALIESFKNKKINLKNFFFVDCVTKTITEPKKVDNCIYVSSPKALTELSLATTKLIMAGFDGVILDSLSTMLIYHKPKEISRFVHSIINKTRENTNLHLILTLSSKDQDSELFKEVEVFVDQVVEL